jgi:hypothetical protein
MAGMASRSSGKAAADCSFPFVGGCFTLADLESVVESLPRPRRWTQKSDYIVGRFADVLSRR